MSLKRQKGSHSEPPRYWACGQKDAGAWFGGAVYQEALRTPGRRPWEAISRKVMRERPNFRM